MNKIKPMVGPERPMIDEDEVMRRADAEAAMAVVVYLLVGGLATILGGLILIGWWIL